jgi:hypothetical protein
MRAYHRQNMLLTLISISLLFSLQSCSSDSTFVKISPAPASIANFETIELAVTTAQNSQCTIIWDGMINAGTYPNMSAQRGSISAGAISSYPDYPYDNSDQRRPWALLKERPGMSSSAGEDVLSLQIIGQKETKNEGGRWIETGGQGTVHVLCQSYKGSSEARASVTVNVQ